VQRLRGIGVSPGTAVGRAVLLMQSPVILRFSIAPDRAAEEVARLEQARETSRQQLLEIKSQVARGPVAELTYLFDAQLLMLDDATVVPRAIEIVRAERVNAEWALQRAYEVLSGIFDEVEDEYLRERKGDVADVVGRLRMNLRHRRERRSDLFRDVGESSVLVADELTPSMAAQVDWQKIHGFASDTGSRTYHTAILARSLNVPAVVGLGQATAQVRPGSLVVIDGSAGEVLIDPPDEVAREYRAKSARWADARRSPQEAWTRPATTADGVAIRIQANVERAEDLELARRYGAEGIGLYRSEFLLSTEGVGSVTEDIQYVAYRSMLETMAPSPVTIRTFDVDEDQLAAWSRGSGGASAGTVAKGRSRGPLGLRAIRLSLAQREVFRVQLRAMLRAARHGNLRIIFPFISRVEEVREARAALREVAAELASLGEAPPEVPVGAMLEIPSAAITADELAAEVDFFSIGTNDLIQYLLAVDRTDARVSRFYEPLHPAVLRVIRSIVRAADRHGIPVSLCGEMASDPVLLPLLLGLGLTEFSMIPAGLPVARQVVARVTSSDVRRVAARALTFGTAAEVEHYLTRALGRTSRQARSLTAEDLGS
jgi:phosphoenolpyruvate-protein phosphotransferase (PTS system enzyme I)